MPEIPQEHLNELINYFKEIVRRANEGDADAQYEIGFHFEHGPRSLQDYEKAAYWYKKSADQGYSTAQCYLGSLYERGLGVPQSYEEALKLYQKAAEQEDYQAFSIYRFTLRRW